MPPSSPGQRRDPSGGDERRRALHTGRAPTGSGKWSAWRPMLTWQQHRASTDQPHDTLSVCHARDETPRRWQKPPARDRTRHRCHNPERVHPRTGIASQRNPPSSGVPWSNNNLEADYAGLKGGTAAPERDSTQRRKSAEPKTLISSPGTNSGCVPQVPHRTN